MKKIRFLLPNAITAMNMLMGYFSVVQTLKGEYVKAAWLIIIALFIDGLDGKAARLLNGFSEFGKELDSFCDAISFGVAPSILSYSILSNAGINQFLAILSSAVFLLSGIMRLVKYNIMSVAGKDKADYVGLPIPAAAGNLATYFVFTNTVFGGFRNQHLFLVLLIVLSALMLSHLPYKGIASAFGVRAQSPLRIKMGFAIFFLAISVFAGYTYYLYSTAYVATGIVRHLLKQTKRRTRPMHNTASF